MSTAAPLPLSHPHGSALSYIVPTLVTPLGECICPSSCAESSGCVGTCPGCSTGAAERQGSVREQV